MHLWGQLMHSALLQTVVEPRPVRRSPSRPSRNSEGRSPAAWLGSTRMRDSTRVAPSFRMKLRWMVSTKWEGGL